jgi:SAM-dependent methyltransferase
MASRGGMAPTCIIRNAYAVYPSFAMIAGMQLDVFTPLEGGPRTVEELSSVLEVRPDKLSPLLYALVPAGLLEVKDGVFANTPEASEFLVRGRPSYMGGLAGFYDMLWRATLNTAESIRTGKPQAAHDWKALPEEKLRACFSGQYPGSLRAGRELARRIDFTRFQRLLDAGGGTGGVSIGICEACPDLCAAVVDLPSVVPISTRFIADAGMAGRIEVLAADLVKSPPEGGYDVAVLRAMLQVMSPDQAREVVANVSRALAPGSHIYIVGCVLDDSRLSPTASLAFGLAFQNLYEDGHSYTKGEHVTWLLDAGFTDASVEGEPTVDGLRILSARKR